ncbi:protein phosphatase CheZ [Deltaproteobacteria bacterium TL4]
MAVESSFVQTLTMVLSQVPEDSDSFYLAQDVITHLGLLMKRMKETEPEKMEGLLRELDGTQQPLFVEIGKLVRFFHDQMKSIHSDIPERLGEMANYDMEDASQRLTHIITMTEKAANTTMDLSEQLMNELSQRTENYEDALTEIEYALSNGKKAVAMQALQKVQSMIQNHKAEDEKHQSTLTDILVAQDYQDLTGQIINRIVSLLSSLERELFQLIETFGKKYVRPEPPKSEVVLQGPLHEAAEDRQSQDQVNDLLASLGF